MSQRPFHLFGKSRQGFLRAGCRSGAAAPPRAEDAARPARCADRRPEIHQGLREIAGPLFRDKSLGKRLQARFCRWNGVGYGIETSENPFGIPVDGGLPPVKGDGRDRCRGVVANARKGAQRGGLFGKDPTMAFDDDVGAGVKVAGARIIAEPLPEMQDLLERCGGQC